MKHVFASALATGAALMVLMPQAMACTASSCPSWRIYEPAPVRVNASAVRADPRGWYVRRPPAGEAADWGYASAEQCWLRHSPKKNAYGDIYDVDVRYICR